MGSKDTENSLKGQGGSLNDHLANERTFLSWIRTSIAIMAFGFVVVKFSLFVKQLSIMFNDKNIDQLGKGYSGVAGILMVAVGGIITLMAFLRYKRVEKDLNNNEFFPSKVLIVLLTIIILGGSIFLIVNLLKGMF